MTDVLPQPDCSLKAVCEPLERCCLDPLEEPGSKRPPNTGARLWGRVRSKLLRQKLDPQTVETKNWHTDVIEMNGIKVEFSMKFTSRDMSLKRTPSKKQTGVFGVKISVVTKRERSKVPYIVRQCVEEVEKRGIEEVGIYRISGVATDIQALKAVFDASECGGPVRCGARRRERCSSRRTAAGEPSGGRSLGLYLPSGGVGWTISESLCPRLFLHFLIWSPPPSPYPLLQFRPQQQHTPWPAWQCRFHGSRERVCVSLFGKPGLGSWGAGDMLAPQRNLEAEALLEHGFRYNKDILLMLSDMDINAIAGTLKLYFRELPEPLLTDRLYPAFMEGIALSDPAAKENCMMHLLRSLPDPNLITFLFLLEHLKRVAEKEPINKMSLHNLATVFGPTLLRPSEVESKAHLTSAADIWSHDVMAQVQVLLYYLQHPPISFAELKRNTLYFSTDV
ncbi:hypothetical protein QTO34_009400 [Cnephaeus nilssonii]|uniref:Rho-GAP domain-containing protein n=1 Tax=Cnephaeus nilssonii TaxID=3371016 RepID=A0AA40HIN4_CNENI|nr:hypothetical protein QTO34_009400 [Eptesicus nilssonii]